MLKWALIRTIMVIASVLLFGFRIEVKNDDKVNFVRVGDSVRVEIASSYHLAPRGKPDIPVKIVFILLPQGKKITGYTWSVEKTMLNNPFPPICSRGIFAIGENLNENNIEIEQCQILSDGYLSGYHIVGVAFYPYEYENGNWYRNDKLVIDFELADETMNHAGARIWYINQKAADNIREMVINPEELSNYEFHRELPFVTFQIRSFISDLNDIFPEGLIITSPDLLEPARRFREEKLKLGNPSLLVSTDEIYTFFTSGENPQKIREMIRLMYSFYGISWVFIIGDESKVPMVELYPVSPTGSSQLVKGDYYYSALDGDFDYNRDGIPGNSANDDPYPELAIGRIEVRNQSEASAVLDKLIKAEKFEYPLRTFRVLLAGGDITRNDNAGRTLKEHVRNILSFAAPYTFTGLYPSGGDMLLNSTNFISELSQGYYLVNHIDHSTDMSLGAGVINSGSSVHYYELLSLSGAPFLFVSMGCNTASHIPQSPMNTLIKLSNSGAFAYIGFSTPSYSTETSADTIIFRALVVEKKTLGDALNKAKLAFSFDQYIKSALTLSGDPSMTIFPPTPETLSLVFPTNIQAGTQTITIRTNSERARIILYQRNNLYKIIESTSDGSATTTVSLIADTLYISATKYGYIPVCRKLPVLQSSLSNLKVVSYEITDFFGDQNGIASPGESLSLFLRVQNTGLSALNMTQILIRTNSPHIHPIDTSIIISNLQPMAQADAQVRIYIPPNNINSYERIRIISSDSSLDERINFYIQSPIIYISSMRRNPPTYPSYGDTITLTIKLKNIGPGNLISPRIVLTPVDSAIEPLDSTFTTPILSQNSEIIFNRKVVARRNITDNRPLGLITIIDSLGRQFFYALDFQAPQPVSNLRYEVNNNSVTLRWNASGSDDVAGYMVYRNGMLIRNYPSSECYLIDREVLPDNDYTYEVYTVDSSGNLSVPRTVQIHTNLPLMTNFPVPINEKVFANVGVCDIDGDNEKEVIVCGIRGGVYILDKRGRNKYYPSDSVARPVFVCDGEIWASPAIADMNGDGKAEIAVATRGDRGKAYLMDFRGELIWSKDIECGALATPIIEDIDNDGLFELIILSQSRKLYIWRYSGREFYDGDSNPETDGIFATAYLDNSRECYSSPAVSDINGDGIKEIVFAGGADNNGKGHIYAFNALGEIADGFPIMLDCWTTSSLALANLDSDTTTKEIVVSVGQNKLYAYSHNGRILNGFPVFITREQYGLSSPSVADINGDGIDEIFVDGSVKLYGFNFNGTNIFYPIMKPFVGESSPLVVDIDSDGEHEIIITNNKKVYAYKTNGLVVPGFPLECDGSIYNGITIAELDGDGRLDIIAGTYSEKLFAWKGKTSDNTGWLTFRGELARKGYYKTSALPLLVIDNLTYNFSLLKPYPQPFNESVTIPVPPEFNSLAVYNILGEKIYSCVLTEKTRRYIWNGKDQNGNSLTSGMYLYKLTNEKGETLTEKLHLIR